MQGKKKKKWNKFHELSNAESLIGNQTWNRALVKAGFCMSICLACCWFCSISVCKWYKRKQYKFCKNIWHAFLDKNKKEIKLNKLRKSQCEASETTEGKGEKTRKSKEKGTCLHLRHDIIKLAFGHSSHTRGQTFTGDLLPCHGSEEACFNFVPESRKMGGGPNEDSSLQDNRISGLRN